MPVLVNDEMVPLEDEDKQLIREIGYKECADLLGKTRDYLRGLCSKGDRTIRRTDLEKIRRYNS